MDQLEPQHGCSINHSFSVLTYENQMKLSSIKKGNHVIQAILQICYGKIWYNLKLKIAISIYRRQCIDFPIGLQFKNIGSSTANTVHCEHFELLLKLEKEFAYIIGSFQSIIIKDFIIIFMESTPKEIIELAKKQQYSYSVVTEPATIQDRNFQLYNVSLKKQYSDSFQYLNIRRGLAYVDQIIDFKHQNMIIAKKGLRKFNDLLPEYINIKQSYFTTSKHHLRQKQKVMEAILSSKSQKVKIVTTCKLNGQNAQISLVYDTYWVIGTKNKTILLRNQKDIDLIKYKHEHKITIQVAIQWFRLLQKLSQDQIKQLKQFLSQKTLVGQYVNSIESPHLINYGHDINLYFYALVQKNNPVDNCLPYNKVVELCTRYSFSHAQYCQTILNNEQKLIMQNLQSIVTKINESAMREVGQGSVLYIQSLSENQSKNLMVCKVKTIQYRIFRKLRQKLKIYIQKTRKGSDKIHKKFMDQVQELAKQFKTPRPLQQYYNLGKRAFYLCDDQTKQLARFINNQYVRFLYVLQRQEEFPRAKFMEIVNNKKFEEIQVNQPKQQRLNQQQQNKLKLQLKTTGQDKNVLVLIPLTIPSTGKTSLFSALKSHHKLMSIHILSSDKMRLQAMEQKMKRSKKMSKKQAYDKTRKEGNDLYYKKMGQILKDISISEQKQHILLLDKNHPQNNLKPTISQLRQKSEKYSNLKIKIVCILPLCGRNIQKKSKYFFPFSIEYILTCLKRVIKRQQHETLEGSVQDRCNIVLGFTNMFRNYSLSDYNLSKYFDEKVSFKFHSQQEQRNQLINQLEQIIIKILMQTKPGSFDKHNDLQKMIKTIGNWQQKQHSIQQASQLAYFQFKRLFQSFQKLSLNEENNIKQEQTQKKIESHQEQDKEQKMQIKLIKQN